MSIKRWIRKTTGRERIEDIERDIEIHRARAQAYRDATKAIKPSHVTSKTPIVSTRTVVCYETGEEHTAILLVHADGAITVKCPGECAICDYERLL